MVTEISAVSLECQGRPALDETSSEPRTRAEVY